MLFGVSLFAVVAGSIGAFLLGWLWYGPLFGKAWADARGLSAEQLRPTPTPFVVNVVGWLLANLVFGAVMAHFPGAGFGLHIGMVAMLWLGFTSPFMATNALFAKIKPQAIAIDVGYPLFGLLIAGVAHALL